MKLKKMLPFVATTAITLLVAFVAVAFLLRPQTLEIGSVVSGATLTSDTVLKAIENALE